MSPFDTHRSNLQRRLLSMKIAAPLRQVLWNRAARVDSLATSSASERLGIPSLNLFSSDVFRDENREVLFILGSGSSIESMPSESFRHINQHSSIGLNYWFLHDFVPSAFSFDAGKPSTTSPASRTRKHDQLEGYLGRPEILKKSPTLLYLRPQGMTREEMVPVPKDFSGMNYIYGRANLLTTEPGRLDSDLSQIIKRIRRGRIPPSVLPDNGASVVRMIFLGLIQGFRNIVLAGVDLDDRPHFYLSERYREKYGAILELFPRSGGQVHGTATSTGRSFSGVQFLSAMHRGLEKNTETRLWIGSPESRLSPEIPLYQW